METDRILHPEKTPKGCGVYYLSGEVPFSWVLSGGYLCAHVLIKDKDVTLSCVWEDCKGLGAETRSRASFIKHSPHPGADLSLWGRLRIQQSQSLDIFLDVIIIIIFIFCSSNSFH